MALVSILIPVFNAERYLNNCLNSILRQDGVDFEVIMVDDGSVDSSGAICDSIAASDPRFKVIHQENRGVSASRNLALQHASGEYVMFVDADDELIDGALQKMYLPGADLIVGGYVKEDCTGISRHVVPKYNKLYSGTEQVSSCMDDIIEKNYCSLLNSVWCKLFKRQILIDNSISFDTNLKYAEDKLFVFSFLQFVNNIRTISYSIYKYILHPGSLSSDESSDRHLKQIFLFIERYDPILRILSLKMNTSIRVKNLYHVDFIGRYVCRILTAFACRKSEFMTKENIELLYSYMDEDNNLSLFSIRVGQVLNILLYKIGKPKLTISVYCLTSKMFR